MAAQHLIGAAAGQVAEQDRAVAERQGHLGAGGVDGDGADVGREVAPDDRLQAAEVAHAGDGLVAQLVAVAQRRVQAQGLLQPLPDLGPVAGPLRQPQGAGLAHQGAVQVALGGAARLVQAVVVPDAAAQQQGGGQRADQHQGGGGGPAARPLGQPRQPADGAGVDRLPVQEALQVVGQGLGAGVAAGRVLLEALQADRLQVRAGVRVEQGGADRLGLAHQDERLDGVLAAERRAARQQVVEDGAQAVHVGGGGQAPVGQRLLGRHVAGRAEDHATLRQGGAPLDALGQAEVGDVGLAPLVEEDVGRLEVAVQDAALVRVVHRAGHLHHQLNKPTRCIAWALRQTPPLDELHAEEVLPLMLADLVDGHDVRVVEVGGVFGLGAEAAQLVGAGQGAVADHLEGHQAAQRQLPRPVDDAHAAARDFPQHLVIAEAPPRRRGAGLAGGAAPQRRHQGGDLALVGEERLQVRRQVRVAGQVVGGVGGGAGVGGAQVVEEDVLQGGGAVADGFGLGGHGGLTATQPSTRAACGGRAAAARRPTSRCAPCARRCAPPARPSGRGG